MADVVDLLAARTERRPHWSGQCRCLGCGHEWVGVGPIGTITCLECPSCSLPKGVIKNLFGPPEGDNVLICDCGCDVVTAYIRSRDRLKIVRCLACGADLTSAFYG